MRFERRIWFWVLALVVFLIGFWALVQAAVNFAGGYFRVLSLFIPGLFFVIMSAAILMQPIAVEVKGKTVTLFRLFRSEVKLTGINSIVFAFGLDYASSLTIRHSKGSTHFLFNAFSDKLLTELNKVTIVEISRWPFKSKKYEEKK